MAERRPNVLVFVTDQQRHDHTGYGGNPVLRTPNIDRIARDGVQFARHYVNNPLCQPARATLFTGLTPRGHGVRTNGIPLDPAIPTMTGALLDAGYRTQAASSISRIISRLMELPRIERLLRSIRVRNWSAATSGKRGG